MATGWTEHRRRYRQYKARTERLPANYHTAIDALEQYLEFFGPGKSDSLLSMLDDPEGQWISRERDRLTSAIDRAAGEDATTEGASR